MTGVHGGRVSCRTPVVERGLTEEVCGGPTPRHSDYGKGLDSWDVGHSANLHTRLVVTLRPFRWTDVSFRKVRDLYYSSRTHVALVGSDRGGVPKRLDRRDTSTRRDGPSLRWDGYAWVPRDYEPQFPSQ